MKATMMLAIASVLVVAGCAQPGGDAEITTDPDITSGTQPIFVSAAELEWFDLDPEDAPGVQLAMLWGDPAAGAFGAFMLLPAGFDSPLHTHTHPMKVVFVSGTYIQEPDGEPVVHLGPGSFMMQPGGDYRHRTSCDTDSDCVFFVESAGAFDMFVVEDSPSGE
jgi:beta-alanine degradation protein BauB